jgi:hypothetical protein
MNCNVLVFCKMIFCNKFGFILETVFSYMKNNPWFAPQPEKLKDSPCTVEYKRVQRYS